MGLMDSLQRWIDRVTNRRELDETAVDPAAESAQLEQLETKLNYSFTDPDMLLNALLHRSHTHVTGRLRLRSNERLEFLGDAVLGLVVNEHLFRVYPDRSEGDLTKMKSVLVCGARLSEVAAELGLGIHIRMSRSEAATGGRKRRSILADTMEALIGAVYLDGGLPAAQRVIANVILANSDRLMERRSDGNYKSRLQEMIQARYKSPPRYRVLAANGPDHARVFSVGVMYNGQVLGQGEGRNKKTAEQKAAQAALRRLAREPGLLDKLPD